MDTPREFSVQTLPVPSRYILAHDHFAVAARAADQMGLPVVFRLEDEQLAVCPGSATDELRRQLGDQITPVYRLGERGPLAVPTGKVFVRFTEGTALETRSQQVEAAGFVIEQTLPYALHAGWLAAKTGQTSDALATFGRLSNIEGIKAVEPQMLMQAARR